MMASSASSIEQAERQGDYLTPQEVGQLLKKSADWVRRRAADGTLPHRYVGKSLRFIPAEVRSWVEQQTDRKRAAKTGH